MNLIKCWSCDKSMNINERSENDGDCIHCGVEIEMDLDFRRDNNIFEVGDFVVSTLEGDEFWMELVCEIEAFHKKMAITKSGGHIIHHYDFRHATAEEIKAGKRL